MNQYGTHFIFFFQIPQQYKNLGRQTKDKYDEHHAKLIHELIECDEFDDIATLKVRKPKNAIKNKEKFSKNLTFRNMG